MKVHRLGALDAYNQKLAKKIAVRGVIVKGLAGSTAYLHLDAVGITKGAKPRTGIEIEVQMTTGIRRQAKRLNVSADLRDALNEIGACRGLFITEVGTNRNMIELDSGDVVTARRLAGRDAIEETKRYIQIREIVRIHLDKEHELSNQGIKAPLLLFIDGVAKYHDYSRQGILGNYARMFEEKCATIRDEVLGELAIDAAIEEYQTYLCRDDVQ